MSKEIRLLTALGFKDIYSCTLQEVSFNTEENCSANGKGSSRRHVTEDNKARSVYETSLRSLRLAFQTWHTEVLSGP